MGACLQHTGECQLKFVVIKTKVACVRLYIQKLHIQEHFPAPASTDPFAFRVCLTSADVAGNLKVQQPLYLISLL